MLRYYSMYRWLIAYFAGFYLLAYAFWVPHLFNNDWIIVIPTIAGTVILGMGLMAEGNWRVYELAKKTKQRKLPMRWLWQILGGTTLLIYVAVYIPEEGRVVAHWPLDLAITIIAGALIIVYGIKKQKEA